MLIDLSEEDVVLNNEDGFGVIIINILEDNVKMINFILEIVKDFKFVNF